MNNDMKNWMLLFENIKKQCDLEKNLEPLYNFLATSRAFLTCKILPFEEGLDKYEIIIGNPEEKVVEYMDINKNTISKSTYCIQAIMIYLGSEQGCVVLPVAVAGSKYEPN